MTVASFAALAIAAVTHEGNRAFCEFLGDTSQPRWADAPDWQRESAVNGVLFHAANPEAGDDASHANWMAEKVAAGWVYGDVKDPGKKTHPCLVPFDQLPPDQQFKDKLFRTLVHAALPVFDQVTPGELAAIERADRLDDELRTTREDLAAAVAAAKAEQVKAQRHAKPKSKSDNARKLGELPELDDEGRAALKAAIEGDGALELVFSTGAREVVEFEPLEAYPAAFTRISGAPSYRLELPVTVKGPSRGVRVRGVALLKDDKQIAWCAFPDPVDIPEGQLVKFERQIFF